MKVIKHPYKNNDGMVYVRVLKDHGAMRSRNMVERDGLMFFLQPDGGVPYLASYDDTVRGSRVISAERVERAVDDADYIAMCREQGLTVMYTAYGVRVGREVNVKMGDDYGFGATVREAYHRYISGRQLARGY